jgi:hypothetical protein
VLECADKSISGLYFYNMTVGNFTSTKKLLVIKWSVRRVAA